MSDHVADLIRETNEKGHPFDNLRFMHFLLATLIKKNGGPITFDFEEVGPNWHLTGASMRDAGVLVVGLHENCTREDCAGYEEQPE